MYGWLRDIGDFFFPRCCLVCGRVLLHDEDFLCCHCLLNLPRTGYGNVPDNPMAQLFYGKLPVERCNAYFLFTEGGDYRRLIHRIKYNGEKECGAYLGNLFARENAATGFFDSIDYLVPVPLHRRKLRQRGYNQSEWIARGLAEKLNKPVDTEHLVHRIENVSQTRKGVFDRYLNMQDVFAVDDPQAFADKHVLLVDDVVTTGSTLEACIQALLQSPGVKASVFALSMAH